MTLQQIDNALAAWNNRLAAVADNLMELQVEPTYQLLTGTGGLTKVPLTGATAARVEPALGAMRTIFDHFGLLHGAIDQAAKLREGLPALFGTEQKLAEIEKLLFGKSIQLPAVNIPLEQRSLLSGVRSAECISAEQLLDPMTRSFAAARDAVAAVSHARDDLAAGISNAEAQISYLRDAPAQRDAARMLAEVQQKLQSDPLGALEDLKLQLQPVLARARQQAEAAAQMRQKINRARLQMDEFAHLHQEALASTAEARAKISGCDVHPSPCSDEKLAAVAAWLDRLDSRLAAGMVDAVGVGLRNWQAAFDACVLEERAARDCHRAVLESRSELRGRLEALKAKARGHGVAEQGLIADLAKQAEVLLYARPTDLKQAETAVVAYEKSLRAGRKQL